MCDHALSIHTCDMSSKGVMLNGPFFTTQRTKFIQYLIIVLEKWEKMRVLAHVQVNVLMMSSLLWYYCNTLLQLTNLPMMSSLLWYYCNTLLQHTTATHHCNTLLKHTDVPMMSCLLWYSNMSGPWASKPRFWSLQSQIEPFFTTHVKNWTLPIIWEFLWNLSNTNHFVCILLRIPIPIWNEKTRGSDWKIKSNNE